MATAKKTATAKKQTAELKSYDFAVACAHAASKLDEARRNRDAKKAEEIRAMLDAHNEGDSSPELHAKLMAL